MGALDRKWLLKRWAAMPLEYISERSLLLFRLVTRIYTICSLGHLRNYNSLHQSFINTYHREWHLYNKVLLSVAPGKFLQWKLAGLHVILLKVFKIRINRYEKDSKPYHNKVCLNKLHNYTWMHLETVGSYFWEADTSWPKPIDFLKYLKYSVE